MLIRNVTKEDLNWALAQANNRFKNNLMFKSIKQAKGLTREGGEKWHVSLTVRGCRNRGGRYYPDTNRHVRSACWHAHGYFYDALPIRRSVSIVTSVGGNYNTTGKMKTYPGRLWHDWTTSHRHPFRMRPLYASEACHCNSEF